MCRITLPLLLSNELTSFLQSEHSQWCQLFSLILEEKVEFPFFDIEVKGVLQINQVPREITIQIYSSIKLPKRYIYQKLYANRKLLKLMGNFIRECRF